MSLYTIILDYSGGTFISQVEAATPYDAVLNWTKIFKAENLYKNTAAALVKDFRQRLSEEAVIAIDTVRNVWCATALVADKLALMNIIKTAD